MSTKKARAFSLVLLGVWTYDDAGRGKVDSMIVYYDDDMRSGDETGDNE